MCLGEVDEQLRVIGILPQFRQRLFVISPGLLVRVSVHAFSCERLCVWCVCVCVPGPALTPYASCPPSAKGVEVEPTVSVVLVHS